MMRGMASSSCHLRRPWPAAAPVAWDEASSSRRRKKRPRYRPPPSPVTQSSSPASYSPTSPSYAPTSPVYSPTDDPLDWPPAPDVIGEEPGSEGQDEEEEEQQSGSERDGSDGYDGEEEDQQARDEVEEEEEEPPRRRRLRDEEAAAGESDGEEQEYSDGSDGENGVEDDEQQASHLPEEEEEEERWRRSGSEREQEHADGSDGGNGVEDDEHQAGGGEQEEEALAADVDLSAAAPPRPSSPALSIRSESSSTVVGEMTLDRTAGLDCGICFLPLKPPIFQCDVGHVVCSPCRDKLAAGGLCHVCRAPTGFRRCHAMEQVVDAVRVPCPHAAHGCADRPAYHDRERHARDCPHAPYRCPSAAACGFAGSAPALAEHAAAAHGWPCAAAGAEARGGAGHSSFAVDLRDGFNFLLVGGGAQHYLLLLNVARTPLGRAVSAAWLRPHRHQAAGSSARCELGIRYSRYKDSVREHSQTSRFHVAPMEGPSASFQFLVPECVGGSDEGDLHVTVGLTIITE